jgi:hypothetical protein
VRSLLAEACSLSPVARVAVEPKRVFPYLHCLSPVSPGDPR